MHFHNTNINFNLNLSIKASKTVGFSIIIELESVDFKLELMISASLKYQDFNQTPDGITAKSVLPP